MRFLHDQNEDTAVQVTDCLLISTLEETCNCIGASCGVVIKNDTRNQNDVFSAWFSQASMDDIHDENTAFAKLNYVI